MCSLDPIEVGYEFEEYTALEEDENVTLCVVVFNSAGSQRPFTVNATTEDGSGGRDKCHMICMLSVC